MGGKYFVKAVVAVLLIASLVSLLSMANYRALLTIRKPLAKADAIVVLAGEHADKVAAAAILYRDGHAPRILLCDDGVFSSWSTKYNRNLYQVEWAEEDLVALGVPRSAITRLPFSKSGTCYDILAAKRYIMSHGSKKIILLTSDYHTRRAYWTSAHMLRFFPVEVGVVPVRSSSLTGVDVAREYAKLVYYLFRFGLLEDLGMVGIKQ